MNDNTINTIRQMATIKGKVYGEYRLHGFSEVLNEAGDKIICRKCGEVRATKSYSPLTGTTIWNEVTRNNKGEIVRTGCSCHDALMKSHRDGRERYKQATGHDIFYDWDVLYRHKMAVPFNSLPSVNDRFYMQHYTKGIALLRDFIYAWSELGMDDSYYFYGEGGTYKTSLMCCIRTELLARGDSCYIVTPSLISDIFKSEYKSNKEELYSADVLIIDDLGKYRINDRLSTAIQSVVQSRHNNEKHTIFVSRFKADELLTRGYSLDFIKSINSIAGKGIEISGEPE